MTPTASNMPKYKDILKLSKQSLKRRYRGQTSKTNLHNFVKITYPVVPIAEPEEPLEQEGNSECLSCIENKQNEEYFEENKNKNLSNFIVNWAVKYNVKMNALNELLVYLNENGYADIPKDSRTLLKTPKVRNILNTSPGHYTHIGLSINITTILNSIENIPDVIEISFNIDGVPLTRSSRSSFWLILCKICNIPRSSVFAVGI